jgi:hypothetical protein
MGENEGKVKMCCRPSKQGKEARRLLKDLCVGLLGGGDKAVCVGGIQYIV